MPGKRNHPASEKFDSVGRIFGFPKKPFSRLSCLENDLRDFGHARNQRSNEVKNRMLWGVQRRNSIPRMWGRSRSSI